MDYAVLCEESNQTSKEKGWQDVPRSFDGDIALMHEELSEALGDYRSHKGLNEVYYEVKYSLGDHPSEKLDRTLSVQDLEEFRLNEGAAYRIDAVKPCGIPTELADLVIRIAHYCGMHSIDLARGMERVRGRAFYTPSWLDNFESFIRRAHELLACVQEHDLEAGFSNVITFTNFFCSKHGIDLEAAIKEKAAYNKTRPYRHGGRKI